MPKVNELEDKDVYRWLRNKTGCGLLDAKLYLEELINAIKHHPAYRTDSHLRLVYD